MTLAWPEVAASGQGGCRDLGFPVLNSAVKEGSFEKLTFDQGRRGGQVSKHISRGENILDKGNKKSQEWAWPLGGPAERLCGWKRVNTG